MVAERPQVLVVTGMSGAGRSTASKVLEDLGYFVIDNLPPSLIREAVAINDVAEQRRHMAVVVDARGGMPLPELRTAVDHLLGLGVRTSVLFLDAEDGALIRRYEENRRPHPLGLDTLPESIAAERELLSELRAGADFVVDTTDYNVHQLRERIEQEFREAQPERPMRVSIRSFGFKHGTPRDVDLMFDVRFLPNPHWDAELRPLTGSDTPVRAYVLGSDDAQTFLSQVKSMLAFLVPRYQAEGKSYLSIGVGCTGGRHRSVTIAEELGRWFEAQGIGAAVSHRDVDR